MSKIEFTKGKVKEDTLNIVSFSVDTEADRLYYLVQLAPKEMKRYYMPLKRALDLGVINLDPILEIHDKN